MATQKQATPLMTSICSVKKAKKAKKTSLVVILRFITRNVLLYERARLDKITEFSAIEFPSRGLPAEIKKHVLSIRFR
ncbi:hypothetical protein G6011_07602 [Alternaria panax]|uniref:Uncharacterized protein n=1 Tax=Alternaria panax TaxID=48097 RepID=A0AAD4FFK2_9PLEO|nr:hypothetical protein G6011_07602 [Alternaria panax]